MGVVFWDVIEEHLDEAESAWQRWELRLDAQDDDLASVEARFEERLFANLDGLDAGGADVHKRTLLPALDEAEGARRRAAAYVLASSGDDKAREAVIRKLGDDGARGDVVRALSLVPGRLRDALDPALNHDSPKVRAGALDVLALRGEPIPRLPVRADDAPELVAAALRAGWQSGDRTAAALAKEALGSPDIEVRDASIAAGIALGVPEAFALCRKVVSGASESTPPETLRRPLVWLAMGGDVRDQETLVFTLQLAPHRASALLAIAAGGRAAHVEACLPWIGDAEAGPLAADAFVAITGMTIEKGMLAEPTPEDELAPAPLPRVRREALEAWWQANHGRFHRNRRTFLGRAPTFETVSHVLAHGPMRRRGSLAEELALRSHGVSRLATRAFAARQREEMSRLKPPGLPFEQAFG